MLGGSAIPCWQRALCSVTHWGSRYRFQFFAIKRHKRFNECKIWLIHMKSQNTLDLLLVGSLCWVIWRGLTWCHWDRIWSVVSPMPTQPLLIISTELKKSNLCGHYMDAKPIHLFKHKSFMLATQENVSSYHKNSWTKKKNQNHHHTDLSIKLRQSKKNIKIKIKQTIPSQNTTNMKGFG